MLDDVIMGERTEGKLGTDPLIPPSFWSADEWTAGGREPSEKLKKSADVWREWKEVELNDVSASGLQKDGSALNNHRVYLSTLESDKLFF